MGNTTSATSFYGSLRLAWIERHAQKQRSIHRSEIMEAFGISPAQASSDLQELLKVNPGCLTYNLRAKRYEWTGGRTLVTTIPSPVKALFF